METGLWHTVADIPALPLPNLKPPPTHLLEAVQPKRPRERTTPLRKWKRRSIGRSRNLRRLRRSLPRRKLNWTQPSRDHKTNTAEKFIQLQKAFLATLLSVPTVPGKSTCCIFSWWGQKEDLILSFFKLAVLGGIPFINKRLGPLVMSFEMFGNPGSIKYCRVGLVRLF